MDVTAGGVLHNWSDILGLGIGGAIILGMLILLIVKSFSVSSNPFADTREKKGVVGVVSIFIMIVLLAVIIYLFIQQNGF